MILFFISSYDFVFFLHYLEATNYYDVKAGEFKTQPIQFTLKITNEKLDEIAKDKNAQRRFKS